MDIPRFDRNFLSGGAAALPVRPRSLSPSLAAGGHGRLRSLETANHLDQALDLVVGIASRYQTEKRGFTEVELAKMKRIGLIGESGVVAAVPAFAAISNTNGNKATTSGSKNAPLDTSTGDLSATDRSDGKPKNESFSSDPDSAPKPIHRADSSSRLTTLFGKLKQATQASHLYQEMAISKAHMQVLADISLRCAAAGADSAAVATAIKGILGAQSPPMNVDIYIVDPAAEAIADPLTGDAASLIDKESPLARAKNSTKSYRVGKHQYHPLFSNDTLMGVLRIDEASIQKSADESHEQFFHGVLSTVTICLRNAMLLASVKWQVDKAEAMLMMANQLSRDNLDERVLVQSIMTTAKQLTESDRCSIFLVNGTVLHAYFEDGKSVTMSIDAGIAGHVAKTGETVNIREAYEDARFNSAVDKATGYRTKTILCMPVHYEGTIVAVAQLINKKPKVGKSGEIARVFSKRDEELFMTFSTFAGVSLRNCRINANLVREKRKSEAVLDVVQMLSDTDIRDVNQIVSHVMLGAKKLLNADRSSLFLIDKERNELYSKVADSTGGKEIRFGSGKGIAGTVASSGIAENIPDAYEDERFNREVDKAFNYRTRSILCEPITCKGDVLAVAQLVNRIDDDTGEVIAFSTEDQATFRTFAMFAGISISNSHLLEFAINAGREAMALQGKLENGLGSRSGSFIGSPFAKTVIGEDELSKVRAIELEETPDEIVSRNFDLFVVRHLHGEHAKDAAVNVVMTVLLKSGLPQKFKCPEEVLLTFVCQCRRRYRNVPYHNFFHVVDACQTVYTFLYEGRVCEVLTDLECFVLMITALVHDLDHMGLNNSFHLKTDSPLGILSSASGNNSVLEVHHCNLAIEILEDPKSNVFIGLDPADAKKAYRGMIDCVLATDMARHGELLDGFAEVAKNFDKNNDEHRNFAMKLIMKAADISNVTKPFEVSRKWAMAVTEEFYQQGDKEKEKGVQVLPMFDRSANNELAKGQIGFINFVCMRFFTVVAGAFSGLQWTLDNINSNVARWKSELESNASS